MASGGIADDACMGDDGDRVARQPVKNVKVLQGSPANCEDLDIDPQVAANRKNRSLPIARRIVSFGQSLRVAHPDEIPQHRWCAPQSEYPDSPASAIAGAILP